MPCLNPKPAFITPPDPVTGKRKVKFINPLECKDYAALKIKYGDMYVDIPCGSCPDCVERRVKSWAIRCSLEAADYDNNCFLSLTYNDNCLPKKGVCKLDIQKFIKKLRNTYGAGIRYYGCAEYGSSLNTERAHYHIILFNFWPIDAEPVAASPFGGFYYKSAQIQKLWKFGFVSVGEVSFNSCAYVARYCNKKLKRDLGIANKNPEFSFMSRRPGIGENYFRKHFDSLVSTDKIYAAIGDKFSFSTFRYFDKLIERVDPEKLKDLKYQRIRAGEWSVASELLTRSLPNMESYLDYQERLYVEKYNRLKRRLQ